MPSRKQRGLYTLQEHLVMQRCPCRTAERDNRVHEVGVLRCPLEALPRAHRPSQDGTQMLDPKMLRDQRILGAHVVVEGTSGERASGGVIRWRRGLAISKQGRDDDEVFVWVKSLVLADQPEVVRYH